MIGLVLVARSLGDLDDDLVVHALSLPRLAGTAGQPGTWMADSRLAMADSTSGSSPPSGPIQSVATATRLAMQAVAIAAARPPTGSGVSSRVADELGEEIHDGRVVVAGGGQQVVGLLAPPELRGEEVSLDREVGRDGDHQRTERRHDRFVRRPRRQEVVHHGQPSDLIAEQDVDLGGEVAEEGPGGDVGGLGDLLDGRLVVAVRLEQLERGRLEGHAGCAPSSALATRGPSKLKIATGGDRPARKVVDPPIWVTCRTIFQRLSHPLDQNGMMRTGPWVRPRAWRHEP